ncbi:MAG: phosphoribosylaminoimidazolesuccinocarboxamide synthase [Defluviitaleaceae bacterium]|nr:phosphoribosylaminoimidazolesuccinocarboxamide synthase [Defluviitaleaceae bacterium]
MKLIFEGKTKTVYENENGTITLKFKDDATGKDGVFDPGENAVGLQIEGLGRESLRLSVYFFELLREKKIPTHYVSSDLKRAEMTVLPAKIFGGGIEFVCRRKADGSFVRRYGAYAKKGADLGFLVETTLKDDARQDPPITKEALVALKIMSDDEFERCAALTKKIAEIISEELEKKSLELFDMKLEYGKNGGEIILIDEISAGCLRVYKNGEAVKPMDLARFVLA